MLVHRPWDADIQRHIVFIQPGNDYPISDWLDGDRRPRLFQIVFMAGVAEVPDNLGQYMIDKGLAQTTALLLPPCVRTVEGYDNA